MLREVKKEFKKIQMLDLAYIFTNQEAWFVKKSGLDRSLLFVNSKWLTFLIETPEVCNL